MLLSFVFLCCFFFISEFEYIFLFFPMMSLAKRLSILVIFSKNQCLVSLIFSFFLFVVSLIVLSLIFFSPLLLTRFSRFLFFALVGAMLDCSFEIFLVSGCRSVLLNFQLKTPFALCHRFWTRMFLFSCLHVCFDFLFISWLAH